ncbi:unnamed protein product [Trichobilharzia szidati]|nr:unnamed protein product [Trichobilharzia szidati]
MKTDDLLSAEVDNLPKHLTDAPIPDLPDGSDRMLPSPYCKRSEVKHTTKSTGETLGAEYGSAKVIPLAEALPKRIRDQMDRRDAVRKRAVSTDCRTVQKQSNSHNINFIYGSNSKNLNHTEDTKLLQEQQATFNTENISGTLNNSSVSTINSPLPISHQNTDHSLYESETLRNTLGLTRVSSLELESSIAPSINQYISPPNCEANLAFNTTTYPTYSTNQCCNDNQAKPHRDSSLSNTSNLSSIKKPKSSRSTIKTSTANVKHTKSNPNAKTTRKVTKNLLTSAAEGLQELSQDSSDADDNEILPDLCFSKQNSILNLSDNNSDRGSSNSSSTSKHTYTMESPSELLDRALGLDQMERSYHSTISNSSVSNSGSHNHENSVSSGTFTRPRLPHTVMPNADLNLKPNSTNGSARDKKPSHRPLRMAELLTFEELDNYLFDTQKLVSQLEQKMANHKSEKVNNHVQWSARLNDANGCAEDYEVAKALDNADQLLGSAVNKRLSAILQRRQDRSRPSNGDIEHMKRGIVNGSNDISSQRSTRSNDISEQRSTRSRRIGQSMVTGRPQSQQPTPRCTKNSNISPYDHSSVPMRNASETRRNYSKLSHISSNPPVSTDRSTKTLFSQKTVSCDRNTASNNHLSISSTPENVRHSGSDSLKNSKMLAALNWQRRKAYDPRQFIHKSSGSSTARSQSRPPKEDDTMSISTEGNSKSCVTSRSIHPTHRLTVTTRRTAPVDTADCIAAMEVVRQIKLSSGVQDILPFNSKKVSQSVSGDSTRRGMTNQHNQEIKETESKLMTVNNRKSAKCESRSRTKHTSKNNSVLDNGMHQKDSSRHLSVNENRTGQKQFPFIVNSRLSTNPNNHNGHFTVQNVPQSSVDESVPRCSLPVSKLNSNEFTTNNSNKVPVQEIIKDDMNYPDIAVESVKYKVEKLTNFIVRLRKRIERDYAEHGTCSPGDDVFGEEAVGAVIAGRPTGMHPVVATCLQNLRILEVNAQEIFNLLYPNEVDFWEPARVCLAEGKDDEKLFNDARSQITEHLTTSIESSIKVNNTTINNNNNHEKSSSPVNSPPDLSPFANKETDMLGVADLI